MTNPTQTPISELTLAQVISLTQAGLISLKDGAPVYTGKADRELLKLVLPKPAVKVFLQKLPSSLPLLRDKMLSSSL